MGLVAGPDAVIRPSLKGRSRISTQLEHVPDELKSLLATLGLSE